MPARRRGAALDLQAMLGWALAAVVLLPVSAHAAHTGWVDNQGGRVRLIATAPEKSGLVRAALDIDLKPGWTTYWRDPGAAGIPPSITSTGSDNVKNLKVSYPPPKTLDEGGVRAIGYAQTVAFPITVEQAEPGKPINLNLQVFLGVCNKICVPVQAAFKLPLAGSPAHADRDMIKVAEAFSMLPEGPSPDFALRSAELSPDGKSLAVTVKLPSITTDGGSHVFVAGPEGFSFGESHAEAGDSGATRFTLPVIEAPSGRKLAGQTIHIVVKDGFRSMATMTTVE